MDYSPRTPRDPGRHGPRGRSLKDRAEYVSKVSGLSIEEAGRHVLDEEKSAKKKPALKKK